MSMARNDKSKKADGRDDRIGERMISPDLMTNSCDTAIFVTQLKGQERNKIVHVAVQATATVTLGLEAAIIGAHHGAQQALDLGSRPEELKEAVNPPQSAELLLHLMPKRDREYILGDLEEDFRTDFLPKFGPEKARRLYWWHAVRSVLAVVLGRVRWLIRVAAVGWLLGKLGL